MADLKQSIKLILGTMTFGEQIFGEDVKTMTKCFFNHGYQELDTAYVYNDGECEKLLGEALKEIDRNSYKISTKVNPRITGKLDGKAVLSQVKESLTRLNLDYIDTLYLHFPDPNTPVEYALDACAQLYDEGKFLTLGLSNFPAWLVGEVYNICDKHAWMLPRVYEGLYNPLSRHAERELDKALNYYQMAFYAYNPLAGGLLTNKYSGKERKLKAGRFINRPNYQQRYWKDSYFEAVDQIKIVCEKYDMDIIEVSYRWLANHSMLNVERGDAVIIGASKIEQLEQNMATIRKGELPEEVVSVIENAWETCKADAPEYFKYYIKNNKRK